jgi:hypothetical protein
VIPRAGVVAAAIGRKSAIGDNFSTRRRRAETITRQQLQKVPAATTIAQLMTTKRDT